jgi:hypothetical protein
MCTQHPGVGRQHVVVQEQQHLFRSGVRPAVARSAGATLIADHDARGSAESGLADGIGCSIDIPVHRDDDLDAVVRIVLLVQRTEEFNDAMLPTMGRDDDRQAGEAFIV